MGKHILIVDDSEMDRGKLNSILSGMGHTISFAVNGRDGIEKAKALKPDLIFMDVVMPEVDGFGATRAIVKESPETAHIPVILCTSKSQKTDQVWGRSQGARAYIVKPATPDSVKTALSEIGVA